MPASWATASWATASWATASWATASRATASRATAIIVILYEQLFRFHMENEPARLGEIHLD